MKTKNNLGIENINLELDKVLGATLQNMGGVNPPTLNK